MGIQAQGLLLYLFSKQLHGCQPDMKMQFHPLSVNPSVIMKLCLP